MKPKTRTVRSKQITQTTAALLAASGALVTAIPSDAGGGPKVQGAKVRHGQATFRQHGNHLLVQTRGPQTIIDYTRFDIPSDASVRFAQPNAASRVLNRIISDAPTMIMGGLSSNGKVYFINRAGVVFGKDARIDVQGLFAAAGRLSDADFLAGRDRVTGMQGQVSNAGVIRANEVVLAGRTVVNEGTIDVGRGGLVALVAGKDVTLRRTGSGVGVTVAGGLERLTEGAAITNRGTVNAKGGRIVATAGDFASLAVDLEGSIVAQAIKVDGGAGEVRLAGRLDATGGANGLRKGGAITVTGEHVHLESGAQVNASGPRGGGTVRIGGGMRGEDPSVANAKTLQVDSGAVVRADATGKGKGGTVVLWSDGSTDYQGWTSARGAGGRGDGGFVEISGKEHLTFGGLADLRGAGQGKAGTVLLDPEYLEIINGSGSGPDQFGIAHISTQLDLGNMVIASSGGTPSDNGILWLATDAITATSSNSLTLDSTGALVTGTVDFMESPNFGGTWTGDFVVTAANGILVRKPFIRSMGNVSFSSASGPVSFLDRVTGAFSLSIDTPGVTTFFNGVGYSTLPHIPLNSLTRIGGGATVLYNGASTSGAQMYDGALRLASTNTVINGSNVTIGGALTREGAGSRNVTFEVPGVIDLQGPTSLLQNMSVYGGGFLDVGADMTIAGVLNISNTTLRLTGADAMRTLGAVQGIQMGDVIGNGKSLLLNSGMPVSLLGDMTGVHDFSSNSSSGFVLGGNITATGNVSILDAIEVQGNGDTRTIQTTGANSTIDLGSVNSSLAGSNMLNVTADGDGAITFHNTVGNSAAVQTLNVTSGGGTVTFSSTVNGPTDLTVSTAGGTTTFSQTVGELMALSSVNVTDGAVHINGSGVITTGAQDYGQTTLGGDTTLISTAGNVTMHGSVNGAHDLSVLSAGVTTFHGAVGNTTALTSLDVTGAVQLNGGSVTTTGDQDYGGPVTLGANTDLISTGGGDLTFKGTLDGAHILVADTTGTTTFLDAVGGNAALVDLEVVGASQLNGGTITTTGGQSFGGQVTLGADTVLTSTGGGSINMMNGVVGSGTENLDINTSGATLLVGQFEGIRDLTLDAAGGNSLNGNVNVTGNVNMGGNTELLGVAHSITAGGDVTFGGTVNGGSALTVDADGTTTFNGAVGDTTELLSLTVTGTSVLNGGSVRTVNGQEYGGPATLGADTLLASTGGGDITLNGVTGAGNALEVQTAGTTALHGALTGLAALTTDAAGSTTLGGSITATGDINIMDDMMLLAGANTIASAGGAVLFGGAVEGPGGLTVGGAGTTTFTGAVGAGSKLASLTVNGNALYLNGLVWTLGNMTLNGPSVFAANADLTADGTLRVNGDLDAGIFDLSLTAGQTTIANGVTLHGRNITLAGPVLGLGSLTLDAVNNLSILGDVYANGALGLGSPNLIVLGGSVNALGNLHFDGDVRVQGVRTVTSRSNGNVTFNGTVNGTTYQGDTLYVICSNRTQFNAALGNLMRMQRVQTDHPGTIGVAPAANVVILIYGELIPPVPPGSLGGVELAKALTTVWESVSDLVPNGRRAGMVDYAHTMRVLLAADLSSQLSREGLATGIAVESTETEE